MKDRRTLALMLALTVCMSVGCVGNLYDNRGRGGLAESVTPVSQWNASGNLSNLQNAIDGNVLTVAVGGDSGNDSITIDLGKVCYFNMVAIDHGPRQHGFAQRVAILTSLSGDQYTYRKSGPGNRRVTVLLLDQAVLARYVRVQVVMARPEPWSVGEVYLQ